MFIIYGIEVYCFFDVSIYFIDKKEELEGVIYCKDCFSVFVKKGEVV